MKGKSLEEFTARSLKEEVKQGFMKEFDPLEQKYKAYIHLCQFKAYQENTDIKKAEHAAQECFKPYLIMQRHVLAATSPAEQKFDECMKKERAAIRSGNKNRDNSFIECIAKYKTNITKQRGKIEKLYKGYLLNLANDPKLNIV